MEAAGRAGQRPELRSRLGSPRCRAGLGAEAGAAQRRSCGGGRGALWAFLSSLPGLALPGVTESGCRGQWAVAPPRCPLAACGLTQTSQSPCRSTSSSEVRFAQRHGRAAGALLGSCQGDPAQRGLRSGGLRSLLRLRAEVQADPRHARSGVDLPAALLARLADGRSQAAWLGGLCRTCWWVRFGPLGANGTCQLLGPSCTGRGGHVGGPAAGVVLGAEDLNASGD